ncbi:MAG: hypothetical protein QGD93_10290 [Actinomycetota bacterium]|nr:hypothetical protein [Actinomycetota bacterium]
MHRLERVKKGEIPSASKHNRLIDTVNALQNITGDGIITVATAAGGINIGLSLPALIPKLPSNPIQFGLAQQFDGEATGRAWKDATGDLSGFAAEVSVKLCDFDGSDEVEDVITVWCYHSPHANPNIRVDDIVAFSRAANGRWVILQQSSSNMVAGHITDSLYDTTNHYAHTYKVEAFDLSIIIDTLNTPVNGRQADVRLTFGTKASGTGPAWSSFGDPVMLFLDGTGAKRFWVMGERVVYVEAPGGP